MCLLANCMSSLDLVPIFQLGCLSCVIELYELVTYFGNEVLVTLIVCKYFLPLHKLSLHFVHGFLCCAKACKFH